MSRRRVRAARSATVPGPGRGTAGRPGQEDVDRMSNHDAAAAAPQAVAHQYPPPAAGATADTPVGATVYVDAGLSHAGWSGRPGRLQPDAEPAIAPRDARQELATPPLLRPVDSVTGATLGRSEPLARLPLRRAHASSSRLTAPVAWRLRRRARSTLTDEPAGDRHRPHRPAMFIERRPTMWSATPHRASALPPSARSPRPPRAGAALRRRRVTWTPAPSSGRSALSCGDREARAMTKPACSTRAAAPRRDDADGSTSRKARRSSG